MKLYFFFKIFDYTRLPPFIYDKIRLGADVIIKLDNPFCVKNLRNQNAYIYFDLVWFFAFSHLLNNLVGLPRLCLLPQKNLATLVEWNVYKLIKTSPVTWYWHHLSVRFT